MKHLVGKYISIKKLSPVKNPDYPTADKIDGAHDWSSGETSPAVDYEVKGHLISPIEKGGHIRLARKERNGEKVEGFFYTSEIQKIEHEVDLIVVHTNNSIYKIKVTKESE